MLGGSRKDAARWRCPRLASASGAWRLRPAASGHLPTLPNAGFGPFACCPGPCCRPDRVPAQLASQAACPLRVPVWPAGVVVTSISPGAVAGREGSSEVRRGCAGGVRVVPKGGVTPGAARRRSPRVCCSRVRVENCWLRPGTLGCSLLTRRTVPPAGTGAGPAARGTRLPALLRLMREVTVPLPPPVLPLPPPSPLRLLHGCGSWEASAPAGSVALPWRALGAGALAREAGAPRLASAVQWRRSCKGVATNPGGLWRGEGTAASLQGQARRRGAVRTKRGSTTRRCCFASKQACARAPDSLAQQRHAQWL